MTGPKTDRNGQIQKRKPDGPPSLRALVEKMSGEIARALPKHVNPERMVRVCTTALRMTPQLEDCTPISFLGSIVQAAQLGLEPNTLLGFCYLIPFRDNRRGVTNCTLIIGYKGMIDLARRSGQVSNVYAYAVREGDKFDYQLGTERRVHHIPSEDPDREKREITHVYAVAKIKDGEPEFVVLTRPQIDARRARSRASKSGPWVTDFEAMCLKTGVRALARWIPQSAEFAQAVVLDEAADRGQQMAELDQEVKDALLSSGAAAPAELEAEGEPVPEDGEPDSLAPPESSAGRGDREPGQEG